MKKEVGFYSLIQYCPDVTVGEVANIGVLLFAPESGFVDVRVTPTNQRVARIFGGGIHKYDTLQQYKEGLPGWVKAESRKFASLECAKSFLTSNADSIVFTPIRGVVCPNGAEKMLDTLFAELFTNEKIPQAETAQRVPSFSRKRFLNTLQKKFGKEMYEKIAILPKLPVVGTQKQVEPAFAFQNKHFNVVFSQPFNVQHYGEQIGFGLLIAREMKLAHERYWKSSIPIILGRFSPTHNDLSQRVAEAFRRYDIPFYANIQTLLDYVGAEAKFLPKYVAEYAVIKQPSLFRHFST